MKKLNKLENIVSEILTNIPDTRNDDFILVTCVYHAIAPTAVYAPFNQVMIDHKELGLPPFESITRVRRKLQADHEELRAVKEVAEARTNKQADYIEYSINGYNPTFEKFIERQD